MTRRFALLLGIAVVGLAMGCAGSRAPETSLGWPPPPAEARVVYRGSIAGSQDLDRSFWGGVRDFLLGRSPEQGLNKPYGIAFDGESRLFVADTGRKCILVLDLAAGRVSSFFSLGPYGRLTEPVNVLLDGDEIYVADTGLARIVVFGLDGTFRRFVGAEGDLEAPVGMALAGEPRRLFVTDTRRHEIRVFDLQGGLLNSFGGRGDERGQFYHPLGLAAGPGDRLYVVDAFHFAVQVLDLDGNYLFSFGPKANGLGSMARPRAIALDSEGHLYVTDALRNNVQVYDREGTLLMSFGSPGLDPGRFRLPAGICVTADDRIYVADSINQRIQEFAYVGQPGK